MHILLPLHGAQCHFKNNAGHLLTDNYHLCYFCSSYKSLVLELHSQKLDFFLFFTLIYKKNPKKFSLQFALIFLIFTNLLFLIIQQNLGHTPLVNYISTTHFEYTPLITLRICRD